MNSMKKLVIVSVPYKPFMSVIKDGCTLPNVEFLIIERKKHFVWKILFRIFLFLKCFRFALHCKISNFNYRNFQNYAKDPDVKFLFWSPFFLSWWYAMGRLIPKQEKVVFCWAPLGIANQNRFDFFYKKTQALGFDFFTMNSSDAKKYNMHLTTQVYRRWENLEQITSETDFYFLGKCKGREKKLEQIQKALLERNFKVDFKIFENNIENPISFEENVLNAMHSRCIVDVVAFSGIYKQTDMTLRPLEALFLGKKLLTNYSAIKDMDFYCPKNIYVIDAENLNLDGIDEFMRTPIVLIDEKIVDQYEVNFWLAKYFLGNCK